MPKVRSGEQLKAYRLSYDYRREYFKRNPGIFGCLWFCSQCYRPLIGKKNVYVDHIVPLAKGGVNRVSNCTAICGKCNRAKSDKVDGRVIKGAAFKFFESNVFRGARGIGGIGAIGVGLTAGAVNTTFRAGKWGLTNGVRGVARVAGSVLSGTVGAITFPLRKGGIFSRLFFVVLYTLAILFLLKNYTHVLDAWLT